MPAIYYTPETSLGFAAFSLFRFQLGNKPELTRRSNLSASVLYTLENQIAFNTQYTIFTNEEKYRINGRFSYLIFPEYYYGIGNSLPEENKESVNYNRLIIANSFLRKISPGLFVGLQYRYAKMFNVEPTEGGLLETSQVAGYKDSKISGLGLAVIYDNRDNILNPQKGAYLQMSNYHYREGLGSEFEYSAFTFDARKYFKPFANKDHILAIQAYANLIRGTAPYKELAELGGGTIMRGYYRGRYREYKYMAVQAEYRMHVWRRFGLTVFGGVGDVANKVKDFNTMDLKPSYGLGIRFKIDPKNNTNLRLDYGLGVGGAKGIYLGIGEAF